MLTPILLIEVIADLKKAAKAGRTPEAEVTNLAQKFGTLGITPNVDYADLVIGDLLGYAVEMRGVPVLGGGSIVTARSPIFAAAAASRAFSFLNTMSSCG
ncbi:MAG: hypothetical protein WBX25_17495 [Rhodomicrobium sp.]